MSESVDASTQASLPLVAESVSKQYPGGIWANRGISLTIGPSEILGLLGPNGSGKTSFVRQITTETSITSGQIRVFGVDVESDPTRVKHFMGVVPQDLLVLWDCSVFHTLSIFGKLRGLSAKSATERAHQLIDELEMHGFENRVFATLSGGERQRIMLAMAWLAQPKLLLLDEPTTGLDPITRREIWKWIRERKEQGSSVLITTHYMEEAETLCDRIAIMHKGVIKELDTLDGLRSHITGEFKLTYTPDDTDVGSTKIVYGASHQEMIEQAQTLGITEFSISKTSMEDVYFSVIGGKDTTEE